MGPPRHFVYKDSGAQGALDPILGRDAAQDKKGLNMHASSHNWLTRGLMAAGLMFFGATGAQAAHIYIPFTQVLSAGGDKGLWLADTANLGNPPYQLTNQMLDGNGAVAILDDWTLNATTRLATSVQPQLLVYGVAGHLYKMNLHAIGPVQPFTNASYAELCSLTALDERPFAATRAYVQAVVEPVGSVNTCASGAGTQTWLIPANADGTVAPTVEPANWSVIGAFTDPTDGSFVRWIVWTGNEVDAYKANFGVHTTLLVGPPAGPAPLLISRQDGTAFLLSASDAAGTHTDRVYRVTLSGSGLVGTFSYADASPCAGNSSGSLLDSALGQVSVAEPSNSGYAVYAFPVAGGGATTIYADNSGGECGSLGGDGPSGGYLGVNEVDLTSGFQHAIAVNESGPATQTPVFLAGGANEFAFVRYTVNGHFWIDVRDFSVSPTQYTTIVANGDGTVLQTYGNSRFGDDIWGGFAAEMTNPGVERDVVYLFSPNATPCTGGTLTAVDTTGFTTTNITGVPADACTALAYGWQPASVGYVQEAGGSAPVEIDPAGGKMYLLLGPDPDGLFENISTLPGYPFY